MCASSFGNTDIVKELLFHGANVNLQDRVRIFYQVMLLEYCNYIVFL